MTNHNEQLVKDLLKRAGDKHWLWIKDTIELFEAGDQDMRGALIAIASICISDISVFITKEELINVATATYKIREEINAAK